MFVMFNCKSQWCELQLNITNIKRAFSSSLSSFLPSIYDQYSTYDLYGTDKLTQTNSKKRSVGETTLCPAQQTAETYQKITYTHNMSFKAEFKLEKLKFKHDSVEDFYTLRVSSFVINSWSNISFVVYDGCQFDSSQFNSKHTWTFPIISGP